MEKYYITRQGKEKLSKDLIEIENELIETNRKMGESVRKDNDLRENPEFMELRVKVMYDLPKKRKSMLEMYQAAIVIEETDEYINFDGTTVIRGSKVELDFDGDICEYEIRGTNEGDIENSILSCNAPLAQAIIGKKIGNEVIFNGIKVKIISVTKL